MFRSRQTSVISDVKENKQSVRAGFSGLYQGLNQNQNSLKSYPEKGEKRNCNHCSYLILKISLVSTIFLFVLAHFPILLTYNRNT